MKAFEVAKKLYPALSKDDMIEQTCPNLLNITDKNDCHKNKRWVDNECIECWEQKVSSARTGWLIAAKDICK
jgi:hypothetical protein